MYAIFEKTAVYDNRDGFAGNAVRQLPGYVYETAELAIKLMPSGYDSDGESLEVAYFVADVNDPFRKPVVLCNDPEFDADIPF